MVNAALCFIVGTWVPRPVDGEDKSSEGDATRMRDGAIEEEKGDATMIEDGALNAPELTVAPVASVNLLHDTVSGVHRGVTGASQPAPTGL